MNAPREDGPEVLTGAAFVEELPFARTIAECNAREVIRRTPGFYLFEEWERMLEVLVEADS